jgi:hypothetical protein
VPPNGVTRILRVGGVLWQRINGAAKTALGGSSTTSDPFLAAVLTDAALVDATIRTFYLRSYCQSINLELAVSSAGGSAPVADVSSAYDGGVIRLSTNVTSGASCRIRNRDFGAGNPAKVLKNGRTSKFVGSVVFKIIAAAASSTISLFNLSDEATSDMAVQIINNGANYQLVVGGATVDLGAAKDTTTFHRLTVVGDGTTVRVVLDGVLLSPSTPQNTAANAAVWLSIVASNASAANTEVVYDDIAVLTGAAA